MREPPMSKQASSNKTFINHSLRWARLAWPFEHLAVMLSFFITGRPILARGPYAQLKICSMCALRVAQHLSRQDAFGSGTVHDLYRSGALSKDRNQLPAMTDSEAPSVAGFH